jgi:hypothetical protein
MQRNIWREQIERCKRMRQWVLDAEHLLDGSWANIPIKDDNSLENHVKFALTNKEVEVRFDQFLQTVGQKLVDEEMDQTERDCLKEFLRVLTGLRPHLIQCYDVANFPRTNNEMEGSIRRVKARYRRISGRKNWNSYLLRYGRHVVFYEWWHANTERWQQFETLTQNIDRDYWKHVKKETVVARSEQLQRFRFLHKRQEFLMALEDQWTTSTDTVPLH